VKQSLGPPSRALVAFLLLAVAGSWWLLLAWSLGVRSPDLGWHLASGRWIVEQGLVPRADPFSYMTEGLDWWNLNWLAQACFYGAYQVFGFTGLEALRLLLLSAALGFGWLNLRARRVRPALGLLFLGLGAWSLLFVTALRPRLFTMAFLSCFAWILARPDPEDRLGRGPAAALCLLLLIWNHLHGGFAYGYCLLGTDALGTALSSGRAGRGWLPARSRWLAGIVSLGLASFFLHPHGLEALWHVARYQERLGPLVISQTLELLPPELGSWVGWTLSVSLILGVVGVWRGARPRLREVLVTIPLLWLCFRMRRGLNPLLIVALPWVAAAWAPLWARSELRVGLDRTLALSWRSLGPGLALTAFASALIHLALSSPGRPNDLEHEAWRGGLPTQAVAAIHSASSAGRVFSRYPDGGLLIWGLYPDRRTYGDGRGDLHGQGLSVHEGQEIAELREGWEERLVAREVEFVLLERESALAEALRQRTAWRLIHEDPLYVVFRRDPSGGSR
jgi:hypothetical protein